MPANTRAKAKVTTVTTTMSKMVFCMEEINLASWSRVLKFCSPTKVSVGE
jgi:hypothetical protein